MDRGKRMKSKVYPTAIAALVALPLLLIGLGLAWFQIEILVEPQDPDSSSTQDLVRGSTQPSPEVSSPAEEDSPKSAIAKTVEPGNQDPVAAANRQGTLRVSNQTAHPVRVALLSQMVKANAEQPASYDKPAHWDFAPEEGSAKGLLLSLPDREISLRQGDILVAFAQDGSQRYWGPYVVGETAIPTWGSAAEEWVLILRP